MSVPFTCYYLFASLAVGLCASVGSVFGSDAAGLLFDGSVVAGIFAWWVASLAVALCVSVGSMAVVGKWC